MNRRNGFTLIEVMIVVAVIAILASVALPAYQEHVRKSRRVDAQTAMMEAVQFMERAYTSSNTYVGADPAPVTNRVSEFYTITLTPAATATTFTIRAVPTSKQSGDKCGTLTLNHAGARGHSSGTLAECWG